MTPFRDSRCPLDYGEKTSCLLAYPALEVWIPIAPKERASLYMMLSEGVKANWDEEFQVPTKNSWLTIERLITCFPWLVDCMNGEDEEAFLIHYYKKDPVLKKYVFRDKEAEISFATMMKIDLKLQDSVTGENYE